MSIINVKPAGTKLVGHSENAYKSWSHFFEHSFFKPSNESVIFPILAINKGKTIGY